MNMVDIQNLNFGYKDLLFKNFNLKIRKGSFTTILGSNGSGKSTLVKIILGIYKTGADILIDDVALTDLTVKSIRTWVGVAFTNPDTQIVAETVKDEIAFPLENINKDNESIEKSINEIAKKLGLERILDKSIHLLSFEEKSKVALASALVNNPKLLILDGTLQSLDMFTRKKILNFLKELNEKDGITIINVTNDVEECLYGTDIVILNNGKLIINDSTENVLNNEKILKRHGLVLPFVAQLSNKLKFYNLTSKTYLNMDELVDDLWE